MGFKLAWYGAFFVALLPSCRLADPLYAKVRFNTFMVQTENLDFLRSGGVVERISSLLRRPIDTSVRKAGFEGSHHLVGTSFGEPENTFGTHKTRFEG